MDKYENRAMELESGIAAFETKSFAHAIKLLSPIADEGNVEAMYRMAIMLQNGLGCQASTQKAFDYMGSAAERATLWLNMLSALCFLKVSAQIKI